MTQPLNQVGPYVVLAKLGTGGMGEVFLARDPRLEREVALKMLPAEFARDSERMARFRREALTLAAINHPNIATIFGLEDTGQGSYALVLERVEGETLADRLKRGALPLTEGLRVGAQIAEAVEAAHARGVIHRDLKPGNVMLGPRGLVKVLDFGLAKVATERIVSGSGAPRTRDTATRPAARADDDPSFDADTVASPAGGDTRSSGTPGYMSPEQVRAEEQDERTDVFSFGCVLYECLSGRRAFSGDSLKLVAAAVLQSAPDWALLPAKTPARVRALLERCLEKDPKRRLGSVREARTEIEEALGIRRASALRTGEGVASVPNNLPRQPTSFVGRESAIEECLTRLAATRLLTMTGVGGCGKTRLGLRLAEVTQDDFPDGVWFVDLASVSDPERVPQATASAVGVREEPGRTLTDTLAGHLAHKRALVLLDNCEHVLQASVALVDALLAATAELKMVATSREGLGVRWEQTYAVPSLSLPASGAAVDRRAIEAFEAVRLFVERATLVQADFALTDDNALLIGEICQRLDGIPLAIELAAARVRVLSVEQIRSKLHDRFRLLAGGSKAALPRHQTLRAAIQWSYDHLAADEQRLLRTLSVFAGGWVLEAAVAVCGDGGDEFVVLDLLTRLVDKSLVVVERPEGSEPRYRFLETVRQYGRDLLIQSGDVDAARRTHRDWFLGLAETSVPKMTGPEQVEWLDRLEVENDNLRAALDWCLETDAGSEQGLRLAAALQWFWVIRGYLGEGRQRLAVVLAERPPDEATPTLAAANHGAGNLAFRQDDYEAARGYYERALSIRRRLDDRRGVAGSLGSLGNVAQYTGRYEEARALFMESLAMNEELGNRLWVATNQTCLGNVSHLLGDVDGARRFLEQAAANNRDLGNRLGEASSLDGLGCLLLEQGDITGAKALFEQALAMDREVGSLHDEAATLSHLGNVARRQGDFDLARSLYARALEQMRRVGGRLHMAIGFEQFASHAVQTARPARAARLWGAADAIRQAIKAPLGPFDRAEHERERAAAQASLGEAAFAAAWRDGSELSLDRALDEALADEAKVAS